MTIASSLLLRVIIIIGLACRLLSGFGYAELIIDEAVFSWRPEVEPFFQIERTSLRNQYSGSMVGQGGRQKELDLYDELYRMDHREIDMTSWGTQTGQAPKQFRVRVCLSNQSNRVSGPTPVVIHLSAKVGQYRVDPTSLLVDYKTMFRTATWVKLKPKHGTVPPLAPGETYHWYSDPIYFGYFAGKDPAKHPTALKAVIELKDPASSQTKTEYQIETIPDHFALEHILER